MLVAGFAFQRFMTSGSACITVTRTDTEPSDRLVSTEPFLCLIDDDMMIYDDDMMIYDGQYMLSTI